MPYLDIVMRSFSIAWKHKYLWLIALFSGEAGSSFNVSYSQRTSYSTEDPGAIARQVSTWINDHAALIVAAGVAWLAVVIAFFILAAVCEGATIRASAEHDAERPFGLSQAWTSGVHMMWIFVRFRLILLALALPVILLFAAWLVGLVIAVANQNVGAALLLILTFFLLLLLWLVYGVYLTFLDRLGSRAIVLEERMAVPALRRAHSLLFKRFGRALLVLLLSIAVAIVIGIILFCVGALIAAPIAIAATVAASGGHGIAWPFVALIAIIFLPIYLVISGFTAAQTSTYWTVAFRRMDVDYAPATYGYPAAPPAPPPAPQS